MKHTVLFKGQNRGYDDVERMRVAAERMMQEADEIACELRKPEKLLAGDIVTRKTAAKDFQEPGNKRYFVLGGFADRLTRAHVGWDDHSSILISDGDNSWQCERCELT